MSRFPLPRACFAIALAIIVPMSSIVLLSADDETKKEPAAKKAAVEDRYAVPDGGVDKLLEFITELQSFQANTLAEHLKHREKAPEAIKAAAVKIQQLEKDKSSDAYKKSAEILLMVAAQSIGDADAETQKLTLEKVKAHLGDRVPVASDLKLAMSVAQGLEYAGATELAADAYASMGERFAKSDNPQFARYGKLMVGSARRLNLVGNDFELSGTKIDGEAFDITSLKGKVVLVDFWATWCGPCLAEYPNIKKNFEQYHESGFEVVGVSLDQDRGALEKYVEGKKVPWITLHEKGGQNPATEHYGILGIPSMILIGRDGKVLSTNARGEELNRLLKEQFAEPANTNTTGG